MDSGFLCRGLFKVCYVFCSQGHGDMYVQQYTLVQAGCIPKMKREERTKWIQDVADSVLYFTSLQNVNSAKTDQQYNLNDLV